MFKKHIGITQKLIQHPCYNETMDCLDINWAKLLTSLNIMPVPLPLLQDDSNAQIILNNMKLDGLILSGGNNLAQYDEHKNNSLSIQRDKYETTLLQSALRFNLPILGVCRGLQIINVYYGGKLIKVNDHAGTRHNLIIKDDNKLFSLPSNVNSFHNYAIPNGELGSGLIALAHDCNNNIEAFYNTKNKILAIMWHPEREDPPSEIDCQLIRKHFTI